MIQFDSFKKYLIFEHKNITVHNENKIARVPLEYSAAEIGIYNHITDENLQKLLKDKILNLYYKKNFFLELFFNKELQTYYFKLLNDNFEEQEFSYFHKFLEEVKIVKDKDLKEYFLAEDELLANFKKYSKKNLYNKNFYTEIQNEKTSNCRNFFFERKNLKKIKKNISKTLLDLKKQEPRSKDEKEIVLFLKEYFRKSKLLKLTYLK